MLFALSTTRWSCALLATTTLLAGCANAPRPAEPLAGMPVSAVAMDRLPGWSTDHIADALAAFVRSCQRLALTPPDQHLGGSGQVAAIAGQAADWLPVCTDARAVTPGDETAARSFVQARFAAYPLSDPAHSAGLFTGYYEPEVAGSREKSRTYPVAVMTRPADLVEQPDAAGGRRFGRLQDGVLIPYFTRAQIDAGALRRQRLDLLYLHSPIDLFFLQIQGSGRIDLPNGHVVRVGYAARNGQPYVPIGRALVAQGALAADDVSAGSIRAWLTAHPSEAADVMELNPSYTFFRELADLSPDQGPVGALGVQLQPLRSVAVDTRQLPLGAPVWVATTNADGSPLQRLMLAQDTGSALNGAVRADIFYGWGTAAEDAAGRMQSPGRAWLLLPRAATAARPAA